MRNSIKLIKNTAYHSARVSRWYADLLLWIESNNDKEISFVENLTGYELKNISQTDKKEILYYLYLCSVSQENPFFLRKYNKKDFSNGL